MKLFGWLFGSKKKSNIINANVMPLKSAMTEAKSGKTVSRFDEWDGMEMTYLNGFYFIKNADRTVEKIPESIAEKHFAKSRTADYVSCDWYIK